MDLTPIDLAGIDATAARLERCADEVEALAARTRHGTSPRWQGSAAERHHELMAEHVSDLQTLAADLREAAAAVRVLGTVAEHRLLEIARLAAEVVEDTVDTAHQVVDTARRVADHAESAGLGRPILMRP